MGAHREGLRHHVDDAGEEGLRSLAEAMLLRAVGEDVLAGLPVAQGEAHVTADPRKARAQQRHEGRREPALTAERLGEHAEEGGIVGRAHRRLVPQRGLEAAGAKLDAEREQVDVGRAQQRFEFGDEAGMGRGGLPRPAAIVGREMAEIGEALFAQRIPPSR